MTLKVAHCSTQYNFAIIDGETREKSVGDTSEQSVTHFPFHVSSVCVSYLFYMQLSCVNM